MSYPRDLHQFHLSSILKTAARLSFSYKKKKKKRKGNEPMIGGLIRYLLNILTFRPSS